MKIQRFPELKVVIVNWCRAKDTVECIQSVLCNGLDINQIVLIDNGSTDDSLDFISNTFNNIKIHALPENNGFAGGYNFGIKTALQSEAKYVFLLNNDTIVDKNAIQSLLLTEWDVGVPKIYFHNSPQIIWSAGARWRKFPPMVVMCGYQKTENGGYNSPHELDYATACALMIKREVFEKAGMFDPDYKSYFEDYDFIYRVKAAGYRVGYVPEARIWHKGAQSLGSGSPEQMWYLGRNSVLFYRKGNRFSKLAFSSYLAWVTIRELIQLKINKTWNFWRGVQDGVHWMRNGISSL